MNDLDRSIEFYTGLLGMRMVARVEFEDTDVVEVPIQDLDGNTLLVLIQRLRAEPSSSSNSVKPWPEGFGGVLCFHVQGLDQLALDITAAGYQVLRGPVNNHPESAAPEFAGLRILLASDPDGYTLEFLEGDIAKWSAR